MGGIDLTLGVAIFPLLKHLWIPLVAAVVVASTVFAVSNLREVFGTEHHTSYADTATADTESFNPKHLTYEVFGAPGTVAMISYFDADSEPRTIRNVHLPWSLTFEITQATAAGSLMAQGDSSRIGCRIRVDDEIKSEKTVNLVNALTFCVLKAA